MKLTISRVAGFSTILDDVSGTVSKQSLTEKQAQGLEASSQACRGVLEDLQELIDKYASKIRKVSNLLASRPRGRSTRLSALGRHYNWPFSLIVHIPSQRPQDSVAFIA